MLVSDFINNSVYTGVNQKLPSYLLGSTAMLECVNYALNDIYTYDGKDWTWMYDKEILDLSADSTTLVNIEKTLTYPIKRLVWVTDKDEQYTEYDILKVEPTEGDDDLSGNELYYKPREKAITVYNNDNKGYIIHYVHIFDKVALTDTIPIPDVFLGALYNLTLAYAYPPYGQYGENKEGNVYAKANQQLVNLAKTDSFQMQKVKGNIH